jgi:hypothetical protein
LSNWQGNAQLEAGDVASNWQGSAQLEAGDVASNWQGSAQLEAGDRSVFVLVEGLSEFVSGSSCWAARARPAVRSRVVIIPRDMRLKFFIYEKIRRSHAFSRIQ